jgi:hypothetical protein
MKTIQLEGNIRGEWKRLGFDIEPFPEGPVKERLLEIHSMTERGERPSDPDLEFAWNQALLLERIYPEGLSQG